MKASYVVALLIAGGIAVWAVTLRMGASKTPHDDRESSAVIPDVVAADSHKPRPAQGTDKSTVRQPPVSGNIAVPSQFQFAEIREVKPAKNMQDLLSMWNREQQRAIQKFSDRFPMAYEFSTAEQYRWMVEHGFPSAEEIVSAEAMSDGELQSMAEGGSLKASVLLADRRYQQALADRDSYIKRGGNVETYKADKSIYDDARKTIALLREQKVPFGGYVMAQSADITSSGPSRAGNIMGGMAVAAAFGDYRASNPAVADRYHFSSSDQTTAILTLAALRSWNAGCAIMPAKIPDGVDGQ